MSKFKKGDKFLLEVSDVQGDKYYFNCGNFNIILREQDVESLAQLKCDSYPVCPYTAKQYQEALITLSKVRIQSIDSLVKDFEPPVIIGMAKKVLSIKKGDFVHYQNSIWMVLVIDGNYLQIYDGNIIKAVHAKQVEKIENVDDLPDILKYLQSTLNKEVM